MKKFLFFVLAALTFAACEQALVEERKRVVNAAVAGLPEDMQVVIHLIYFEEMTYEEAAKVMKKNRKQVDNLLYRAKKELRRVLDWFRADPGNNRVHTFYNEKENKDVYMIALRDDQGQLIGYYEKHDYRNRDMTPMYDI